eukprot:4352423-Karenia_brevis.AAC.1
MHERKKSLEAKLAIEIPNEGSEENTTQLREQMKVLEAELAIRTYNYEGECCSSNSLRDERPSHCGSCCLCA